MAGFQQVRINKDLVFVGSSAHTGNIKGLPSYDNKVVYYDDFWGKAIDDSYDYTAASVNGGTYTITAPHCLTLTTGAANNDDVEFAMGLDYYGQYNATLEARFRIDDVDETAINIGFNDLQAVGATDLIAMSYSGVTLLSTAANFAGFMHDAAANTSNLYGVSVNAGADGSVINSTSTPTDAKWYTVRVELRDNGTTTDALFYVNTSGKEIDPGSDLIGIELDAIARATVVCPYIAIINHDEAAINTLDVDYLKVWQDRQ